MIGHNHRDDSVKAGYMASLSLIRLHCVSLGHFSLLEISLINQLFFIAMR